MPFSPRRANFARDAHQSKSLPYPQLRITLANGGVWVCSLSRRVPLLPPWRDCAESAPTLSLQIQGFKSYRDETFVNPFRSVVLAPPSGLGKARRVEGRKGEGFGWVTGSTGELPPLAERRTLAMDGVGKVEGLKAWTVERGAVGRPVARPSMDPTL